MRMSTARGQVQSKLMQSVRHLGTFATRRIARTIFVGSAPTLHTAHKGIERQHVWLGVAIPAEIPSETSGPQLKSSPSARRTYTSTAGVIGINTQASVTRTAQDYADRLRDRPEEVWKEIADHLASERSARGQFGAVHPCPEDSAAVPGPDDAARDPSRWHCTHVGRKDSTCTAAFAQQCLDTRGTGPRINRNSLVFLAPDDRRMEELGEATRDFMAWRDICRRTDELGLPPQQKAQAELRRDQAGEAVRLRIAATYVWVLVPEQQDPSRPSGWQVIKAEGSQ